jgi:hypothetical protein
MNEPLSPREKLHYTNMWCRSIGIKSIDLETHKSIDDVVLLVNFRQEFWSDMDSSQRGIWAALWSWSYHKSLELRPKHINQLTSITNSVIFKRQKQAQRLGTIRQMREQRTKMMSS